MWMQEALQTHPRVSFRSAVEAQRAFADINTTPGGRRAGVTALQVLLRTTCGEPLSQPPMVLNSPPQPEADAVPEVPNRPEETSRPFDSMLRAVFSKHGPN